MSRFEKFQETTTRWGTVRGFWATLMRLLHRWFFLARVQVIPLDRGQQQEVEDGLDIRVVSDDELRQAALDMPKQLDREFTEAALARGDVCAMTFDGDKLVGFIWASFTNAPHDRDIWVSVESPYAYGYKSFVLEEYRGRRLLSRMAYVRDKACIGRGRVANVGFVETHNYASHRAGIHAGGVDIGFAGYVKLFGKCYPFRTKAVRLTSFCFYQVVDLGR
ncbi:MAG: hypothetical protein AAF541_04650 [Pseudomonadota bacterium]